MDIRAVCTRIFGHHIQQSMIIKESMIIKGKDANSARGQLNKKNTYFSVPARAWEFGLARHRFGCPVPRQSPHSQQTR